MTELYTPKWLDRRTVLSAAGAIAISGLFEFLSTPRLAYAETSEEVRAQANEVWVELEAKQAELQEKSDIYYALKAEEDAAQAAMDDAQRRIDNCMDKIEKLKHRLATRVKNDYKSGGDSFLDILFGSTSFSAFINNVQISAKMSQDDTETVLKTQDLQAEIEAEKAEYARQKAIWEVKRVEAEEAMDAVQAVVDEIQARFDELDRRANQLAAEERYRAWLIQQEILRRQAEQEAAKLAEATHTWTNTGNAVVDRAGQWVGNARYVLGACSPGVFDCSGLVVYALTGQYNRRGWWTGNMVARPDIWVPITWAAAQPGDIAILHNGYIQHTGILAGYSGGHYWMIHAASEERGVVNDWVDPDAWGWYRYNG